MNVGNLIDELSKYDRSRVPLFGELVDLIGGIGAVISRRQLGVKQIDDTIVIYLKKEEDPDAIGYSSDLIIDFNPEEDE